MFCNVCVRFGGDMETRQPCLGKGVILLMEGIELYGSIRHATIDMGMAYSKAWKVIRSAEQDLGITLVARDEGTGSMLTEDGKRIVRLYRETMEAAEKAADEVFKAYLAERENAESK